MKFDAEIITKEVTSRVMQHMIWQFMHQLFFAPPLLPPITDSPLGEQISQLCRVANGEVDRATADPEFVGETAEMVQSLAETLFSTPLSSAYAIPEAFWRTDLGRVIAAAQLWVADDELITLSEAAEILRGQSKTRDLVYIRALIKKGDLTRYSDPDEPNSQRDGRVRRSEVENLKNA